MKNIIIFFLACLFVNTGTGQDTKTFVPEGDARYFDFWPGKWYVQNEDKTIDSLSFFNVKKGVHEASFVEEWYFKNIGKSIAIRTWDKTNNKWGFVWASENGLYQVWNSKKIGDNWFIYNQFTVNGETYLSRQGFIPQKDGTVLRISEKSIDEIHWETRFKQILIRQKDK
ncbi:hypothetical protein [Emticicia sp. BO119]|uniref:hypothetical protein n=1 Tax=Emticicia sp. BO119 TaxID=2757768 RepID=UPI0015F0C4A9|nr:hypothetical protein [Emticicia sp. BO119]MBA4849221.1 hypothetical protein [Emticicia sp. BO119]